MVTQYRRFQITSDQRGRLVKVSPHCFANAWKYQLCGKTIWSFTPTKYTPWKHLQLENFSFSRRNKQKWEEGGIKDKILSVYRQVLSPLLTNCQLQEVLTRSQLQWKKAPSVKSEEVKLNYLKSRKTELALHWKKEVSQTSHQSKNNKKTCPVRLLPKKLNNTHEWWPTSKKTLLSSWNPIASNNKSWVLTELKRHLSKWQVLL